MKVKLFIRLENNEEVQIDTFDDERISVTSKIQDISDISKTFTDYSQTFTVPKSERNNSIFTHWYENSHEGGFDYRKLYDGRIEIEDVPFRTGKWQITSAKEDSYSISFFGTLVSLTDLFGEDTLKDLQALNLFSFPYNATNVLSRITSVTPQPVMFPFISSERIWDAEINNTDKVVWTEFLPAVSYASILASIGFKYGISFIGNYFSDDRFKSAYLWFKDSKEDKQFLGEPVPVTLSGGSTTSHFISNVNGSITYIQPSPDSNIQPDEIRISGSLSVSPATIRIRIYRNGELYETYFGLNSIVAIITLSPADSGAVFTFDISTSVAGTFTGGIDMDIYDNFMFQYTTEQSQGISLSTSANIDLTFFAPAMKVSDFFSGMLKQFNLTCFSTDGKVYEVEQLEEWYSNGTIRDFTQYTIDDFVFDRVPVYKRLSFKYEDSETVLNTGFNAINERQYGSLISAINSHGQDYEVKLPFELLVFQKIYDQMIVAYAVNQALERVLPKPVSLYLYGRINEKYRFDNGSSIVQQDHYNLFGSDVPVFGTDNSLAFGTEISILNNTPVTQGLYRNYYLDYLTNLTNIKARFVKVPMQLPTRLLTELKLNDRIVIDDKRYIINSFTTDLLTGKVDFELLPDFRALNFNNSAFLVIDYLDQTITIRTSRKLNWNVRQDDDSMINSIDDTQGAFVIVDLSRNGGVDRFAFIESDLDDRIVIKQLEE